MAYPSAPTFLLTRQISSFLHTSIESLHEKNDPSLLSPVAAGALPSSTTIQTTLILSAAGSLLAYESPLPVRTLRTYCSVAASLWTLHGATAPSVSVALNQPPQPQSSTTTQPSKAPASPPQKQQPNYFQNQTQPQLPTQQTGGDGDGYDDGSAPVSIAASFKGGAVFVVRRLRCGLLFACSTPSPHSLTGSRPSTATVDPATVTALPVSVSSEDTSAAASESESAAATEPATAATEPAAATEPVSETAATEPAAAPASVAVGEPTNTASAKPAPTAPATKPAATSTPASTSGLPASAITTPSSLLRHSTQPLLHKPIPPAATESSDRAAASTPIAVPSKQQATDSGAGDLVGSLAPGSAATAETYQTAHTGGEHTTASSNGPDSTADRDANADAASLMTTGTSTTIGAGGRGGKVSVAATLAVTRRQVDELARMLDDKLGALEMPEDSIGWNGFCSVWTD